MMWPCRNFSVACVCCEIVGGGAALCMHYSQLCIHCGNVLRVSECTAYNKSEIVYHACDTGGQGVDGVRSAASMMRVVVACE